MFAYCGNNPISCVDPTGCSFQRAFSKTYADFGGSGQTQAIDIPDSIFIKISGMINGQAIFQYAQTRMGWGTHAQNGCGIIAIYNAMQLLGFHESLGLIEAEVFNAGGFWVAGLLGIAPWAINNYFSTHDISCSGYSSFYTLSQNVHEGSVIVFMVLNDANTILSGAHYMAAQYINGEYIVYNMYIDWSDPVPVDSLYEPYNSSGFLYGFIVGG